MRHLSLIIFLIMLIGVAQAQQISTPAASPLGTVTQMVGLTEVSITYSRPNVNERAIFGELVPYGELWRTGANTATKLTLSGDATLGGKLVKAGDYAIFTIPGQSEWTIIINSNTNQGGTAQYEEAKDVARFTVKPNATQKKVETMTFTISDVQISGANIDLEWENTSVRIPLQVDTDSQVTAQIERAMNNPEAGIANLYFQSADYYYRTGKDLSKALDWINKSVEINHSRFWVLHLQAKIMEKTGDAAGAKNAAEQSMRLAEEAQNMDYVRLNKELIARVDQ